MAKIATVHTIPGYRPRRESPKHCYIGDILRPISGFDLLANPRVAVSDIIPAIPALGTIDPQLLARVQIDGAWLPCLSHHK